MTKTRIAVDMDEVIADSIARFQEWYTHEFGQEMTRAQLRGKSFHEAVALEHQPALRDYPNRPGFFKDLPLMADSQRVLQELAQRHELFIASAAMEFPNSFLDKYEWLQLHFSFIPWRNVVFCGDKSILNADFLIDDNAFNFENFRGEGLLFDAPHNAHETRYRRVHSWQEIGAIFL
jgi:5'(3')-deoxyribonucleotidase